MLRTLISRAGLCGALLVGSGLHAAAEDKVLVRVNDIPITEAHLKLAADEIGPQILNVPDERRRQVLTDYMIENTLLAIEGKKESLGSGDSFDARMTYYKQRALRDAYFDKSVTDQVTDADLKASYDKQFGNLPAREEVRARHILVKTEADARDVVERLGRGDEFAELAKELSTGPSGPRGGDLGYFQQGQMVQPFDEAVFKLEVGGVSEPVKTQFGWHVIKLEDKRTQEPPKFGPLKSQLRAALVQQKAIEVLKKLREGATITFEDKELEAKIKAARREVQEEDLQQ